MAHFEDTLSVSTCAVCGSSLQGQRSDARTCSPACRREASRARRLALGLPEKGYGSLRDYDRRSRRAKAAPWAR